MGKYGQVYFLIIMYFRIVSTANHQFELFSLGIAEGQFLHEVVFVNQNIFVRYQNT